MRARILPKSVSEQGWQGFELSHTAYLNLVSGKSPSLIGVPARLILTLLSWPYAAVVGLRNYLYSTGRLKARRVEATVISIGNLTAGGTGKTPLVVWLCRYLGDKRLRSAILTRGYKTLAGELSDEPALLAAQCPNVPVIVDPDRVAGAGAAIRNGAAQVLVMDDGFQHRRLARDLDIVTVDATVPFGYGRVLPAGLLREPVTGLQRAHAVVLTRCDQVTDETLRDIEETVRRVNHDLVVVRSAHVPSGLRTADGAEIDLGKLRDQRVFAFCGLGNPQAFFRTLEHLGAISVGSHVFDDHHHYTVDDLRRIRREARERQGGLILTTQKDWMKIAPLVSTGDQPPLACLAVEMHITAGADRLTALIDGVLSDTIAGR